MLYDYPISQNEDGSIKLNGGFYQGFFKSDGEYQILPSEIYGEWNFEFDLRKVNYEPESNKTLNDAVASNEEAQEDNNNVEAEEEIISEDGIITTDIEKEGYFIVRSIASEIVDPDKVAIRDRKHYCNILYDNNQRYPIVRFYFNNEDHLRVEFYDEITLTSNGGKKGEKVDIDNVSEIYNHKERILSVVNEYLKME